MPGTLEAVVHVSAAWAAGALLAAVLRACGRGRRRLFARTAGSPALGVRHVFTSGLLPQAKESVRLHLPSYVAGIVFHAGVLAALGLLAARLAALDPPAPLRLGALGATLAGALAGLGLLARRASAPLLRRLSVPDDYVANVLTTAFVALAALALATPAARPAWLASAALLLLYVPLGKVRHCLFFFLARGYMGAFFGRRGVLPPLRHTGGSGVPAAVPPAPAE